MYYAESHTIYWRNEENSEITHAMCFFTNDGKIILGLSTETKYPNTEIEDDIFKKMKNWISSPYGLVTYEEPAPDNGEEFKELIKKRKHNNGYN